MLDRAAHAATELVLYKWWLSRTGCIRKEVARIQDFVPHELIAAAMECIAPGFRSDVDHAARIASILGTVAVGLNAKLGNSILTRDNCDDVAVGVVHGDAVEVGRA